MSIADKLTTIAENEAKVYEAGKNYAYANPQTPTDNRTNLAYWYQYVNTTGVWNEKWSDDGTEYFGADTVDELDYPIGTQNVTEFHKMCDIVVMDTAGYFYMESCAKVKKFNGTLDMSNSPNESYVPPFTYSLEDAGTIILPKKNRATKVRLGIGTTLKHIKLIGVLDNQIVSCASPNLTKESLENIISCLVDTPTNDLPTIEIKQAVRDLFTNEEWEALIATKPKWTISLI